MGKENKKYTIDEIIDQNRCWKCERELDYVSDEEYSCSKCGDTYWSCKTCELERNGAPLSCDSDIVDKGEVCWKCGHHFCIGCWQNADFDFEGDDRTGNGWMCDDCLNEQKARRALKKKKKQEAKIAKAIEKKSSK